MKADQALQRYLEEAISWDTDRVTQTTRSARTAWWVAGAGWVCAMTGGACLLLLLPLKSIEPFLIRVDSSTGIVDVVPVYAPRATPDELVTRYFLTHYITVCERFNFATAESDYEECGAFNTSQRNQSWYALWNTANPASPLNIHKDGSIVRVQVESVSFFKRANGVTDLAQVRYQKLERRISDAPERITHWIATVQYSYATPSQDPKIRRWNPLGFKIVESSSEAEAFSEPAAASSTAFVRSGR